MELKDDVANEFGKNIKFLRSNNAGEYILNDFFLYCHVKGILCQMTCPNTPQQNKIIEWKLCYRSKVYLSWLNEKKNSPVLWAEAIKYDYYVTNRLRPCTTTQIWYFEILYSQNPNVNYFRLFDSGCYVHLFGTNRTKLDSKVRTFVCIGYVSYMKGWICMYPKTPRFTISRDVIFNFAQKVVAPGDDQDNSELLFLEVNVQHLVVKRQNNYSPNQNISEVMSPK